MNKQINMRQALGILIGVAFLSVVLWLGLSGAAGEIGHFIIKSATFAIKCAVVAVIALALVWGTQAVRALPWFDMNGAGEELAVIRKRVLSEYGDADVDAEQPGDAIACAIQYTGTTILIGIVLLAFFLMYA